jgi:endonuclease YncB( thermonuclease family)
LSAPVPEVTWTHPAVAVRVIDGDTFVARVDLGKYPTKFWAEPIIRLNALYAPERNEIGGSEATAALTQMIMGRELVIQTKKADPRDPYGRVVADVWVGNVNVSAFMVSLGHGVSAK